VTHSWWIACTGHPHAAGHSDSHRRLQGRSTPTDNRLFDLHAFAEYGKEGVLALFQDSTNVERKGYTPSERAVRARFQEIFSAPSAACSSPASHHRSTASS